MQRKKIIITLVFFSLLTPSFFAEVRNRDEPEKGVWDFNPVKIWQADKAGEDVFGLPFTIRVSEDARLYIYDIKNSINYILDSEGKFKRRFAKGGQGPGEVIGQGRTFLVDDKVIISGMNSFHYFSKEGDFLRIVRQNASGLPPHLFLNEDEFIAAPLTGFHAPRGKGKILLQNLKVGSEKVVADFSSFRGGVGQSGEHVFDMVVVGLSPLLTIGKSPEKIYWGMSDSYLIHMTNRGGEQIDSFSVRRKPTRISKKTKRMYFKRSDLPADALNQIVDSFPNTLTHFHRIEWHNGLVYVFVPELDLEVNRGRIRQIDIFSPEGEYLYRAEIQLEKGLKPLFSPLDNLVFQGKFMYTACEKEDDTVVIVKHHVDLPGQ